MSLDPNDYTPEEYAQLLRQKQQAEMMQSQSAQESSGGGGPSPMMAQQFMGGGASGGSSGGMAGAAWPAALAAVIIANESMGRKQGRRPEDKGEHLEKALTGEVLEMDSEGIEKMIGGGRATRKLGELGNPKGVVRNAGKLAKPWEWELPF